MKSNIAIITNYFLNPDDPSQTNLGGVETWIGEFSRLLIDMGYIPIIYQSSVDNYEIKHNGSIIIGTGKLNHHKMSKVSHKDIKKRHINRIVYATSFVGEKYFKPGQIFIQHGIHWDYTDRRPNIFQHMKWEKIRKKLSRHDLKMYKKARLTISVDTNFINYARVELGQQFDENKISYIPNFAVAQEQTSWYDKWEQTEEINIIFARRFVGRRGVYQFAIAIEHLIGTLTNINVLIAGTGSAENFLRNKFRNTKRVLIKKIPHEQIVSNFNQAHIVVIPSTYSEGTSLSCLEAMASGCAVIATNVGGLCNIVLPDFNGLLIKPTTKEIEHAITQLSKDFSFAKEMALNGYETVSRAFSLTNWRKRVYKALSGTGISNLSNSQMVL